MTATRPATRSWPILFSSPMVKAILDGSKTMTRRVVVVKSSHTSIPRGHLTDLSRAWADCGFPTDEDGDVMPTDRWVGGNDPAPASAYRNHYLHVPFAHPEDGWEEDPGDDVQGRVHCPYGIAGDTLWVRETWTKGACWWAMDRPSTPDPYDPDFAAYYRADGEVDWLKECYRWRPSIFMPRWASRITLEITGTRVEHLREITEADAVAEGVGSVAAFRELWDEINGRESGRSWSDDPWAWVVAFRRVEPAEVAC